MSSLRLFQRVFRRAAQDIAKLARLFKKAEMSQDLNPHRTKANRILDTWQWVLDIQKVKFGGFGVDTFLTDLLTFLRVIVPRIRSYLQNLVRYRTILVQAFPNAADDDQLIHLGSVSTITAQVQAANSLLSAQELINSNFPAMLLVHQDDELLEQAMASFTDDWYKVAEDIAPDSTIGAADESLVDATTKQFGLQPFRLGRSSSPLTNPPAAATDGIIRSGLSAGTYGLAAANGEITLLTTDRGGIEVDIYISQSVPAVADIAINAIAGVVNAPAAGDRTRVGPDAVSGYIWRLYVNAAGAVTLAVLAGGHYIVEVLGYRDSLAVAGATYIDEAGNRASTAGRHVIDLMSTSFANRMFLWNGPNTKFLMAFLKGREQVRASLGLASIASMLRDDYDAKQPGIPGDAVGGLNALGAYAVFDPAVWVTPGMNLGVAITRETQQRLYRLFYETIRDIVSTLPLDLEARALISSDLGL